MTYNVVVEGSGIERGGNIYGVRTWTTYKDKEEYDLLYRKKEPNKIIAEGVNDDNDNEGVTDDMAVRLTAETPIESRLAAAVFASLDGTHVNEGRLMHNLRNAAWAVREDRRMRGEYENTLDF